AILLAGGDKCGADQRRFYKRLISIADDRYDEYLTTLKKESKHGKKTR
ncbi:MAG: addiction module toxin RelE, partial [Betaproteobacteria bacterium]|nr:addiction module toxin RelE [Betaproteobacteria bacterium]